MKNILSALLVFAVLVMVLGITNLHEEMQEPHLYLYMTENFKEDTGAHNAIAAILLNYRMYDTMFEALILLTAIIGMKQFLPSPEELEDAHREKTREGQKL